METHLRLGLEALKIDGQGYHLPQGSALIPLSTSSNPPEEAMPYLESLIAGYWAGLAIPSPGSLDALRTALVLAVTAEERGRCLGSIAFILANQRAGPAIDPPSAPTIMDGNARMPSIQCSSRP